MVTSIYNNLRELYKIPHIRIIQRVKIKNGIQNFKIVDFFNCFLDLLSYLIACYADWNILTFFVLNKSFVNNFYNKKLKFLFSNYR